MKVPIKLGRGVCRLRNIHGATMGHMPATHITHKVHTSHSQFKSKHKVTLQTGDSSVTDTQSVCSVYVSIYCVNLNPSVNTFSVIASALTTVSHYNGTNIST